jgi:thiol-disulfide isomerase/thioredoxin
VRTLTARLSVTFYIAFGAATAASASTQSTLKIGDPAPAMEPITWLQGAPITQFEPGRVYVVEFWATWCPPCIKAIPHLSALQRKYATTLTVIGINADTLLGFESKPDVLHEFMKKHGKEMAYTVAQEDPIKKTLSDAWITASGSMGAPTAGIIDQYGKLVWIGYPDRIQDYGFDQALQDTLAGKVDLARSRALQLATSQETDKYYANTKKSHKVP